jgi:class 3 adenylate cyclase
VTSGQPITRGFLFADLRGYTQYVEQHGDVAGADLLAVYRRLVRASVEQHAGAEIRTEGDSFFVVFPSASGAVQCGLDIIASARAAASAPDGPPLRVGIGVHAGETAETEEGLVGSAINIAARVCSVAGANEVLVTEIVRFLTRTSLPLRFTSRGSPKLKGIAEPIALYRVDPAESNAAAAAASGGASRRFARPAVVAAIVAIAILIGGAAAVGLLGFARPSTASAPSASAGGSAQAAAASGTDASAVHSGGDSPLPTTSTASPDATVATSAGATSSGGAPSLTTSESASASDAATAAAPGASFPSPDEATLLAQLPPEIASSCVRADTATGALSGIALRCDLPLNSAADTAWWDRPQTHAQVTLIMDDIVRSAGVKAGTCSPTVKAASGTWKLGDTFSGRLVCWQDATGAWIAWSYFDEQVVARATRRDGDWKALYGWWENTAGFLHQSAQSIKVPA